jgi:glycosyltransferase involved in cell wall biosynthesis
MEKLIDIIIPAYNAHKTINKTLGSIVCQSIIDKCTVTIVNDGGDNYSKLIEIFSEYMDIREIGYQDNRGPGQARQYGIDNTNCQWLVFVDADDTFYGALTLEIYMDHIGDSKDPCAILVDSFYQPTYSPSFDLKIIPANMTWMFAKVYNRNFINKYNIRFNESRANEDAGFNTVFEICLLEDKTYKAVVLQTPLYCWNFNPDSITRINNSEFYFKDNLISFVDNIIYAIKRLEEIFPNGEKIKEKKIELLVFLYYVFCQISNLDTKYVKKNLYAIVKFYNEVFKPCDDLDKDYLNKKLIEYSNIRLQMLQNILPDLTLKQFLNAIRSANYDPNMQID